MLSKLPVYALAAVLLTGASAPSVPAPEAVPQKSEILSHRAYYKLTLDSAKNNSDVKGAEGLMMFEWQDACDGWIIQQKLDVQFAHEEGEGVHLVSNYTTWEAKDGLRYSFNYRSTVNDNPYENFRGSASLPKEGEVGVAQFTLPEKKEVKLPAGAMFPTAHTFKLLKAAGSDQKMFVATVFDGTDAVGMSEISAVISAKQPVKDEKAKQGLVGAANAWPLRMAFYDYGAQSPEPKYEMDTNMLSNGVSEFMLLDYGKFRLRGQLEKIELLPKSGC